MSRHNYLLRYEANHDVTEEYALELYGFHRKYNSFPPYTGALRVDLQTHLFDDGVTVTIWAATPEKKEANV